MQTVIKDYYGILELPPSSTLSEIKKAYRRLAQQYHPDKNSNDPGSNLRFAEIKEAYEVLSDPSKKEYYLQQRWYQQSLGKKKFQQAFSPVSLLQQVIELERYVSHLDAHRMDRQGLFEYMLGIIPDEVIQKLNAFKDESVNKQIIHTILRSTHHLSLSQLEQLSNQIQKIEPAAFSKKETHEFFERKQKMHVWEQYRLWFVILGVGLICLLIFFATR